MNAKLPSGRCFEILPVALLVCPELELTVPVHKAEPCPLVLIGPIIS